MRALLALEDGTIFEGESFGATGRVIGEMVFNTGMASYQDVLTDPTNYGQIVTMTYPLIGNCGVNIGESVGWPCLKGIVMREGYTSFTMPKSALSADTYMRNRHIVALCGIDTRALTRRLRLGGQQNGMIISGDDECGAFRFEDCREAISSYRVREAVRTVVPRVIGRYEEYQGTIPDEPSYSLGVTVPDRSIGKGLHIAVINFGACEGVVKSLRFRGCTVTVYPPCSETVGIMLAGASGDPDGIVLSGGPGDPKDCLSDAQPLIKAALDRKIPVFGIGLGHQLMALTASFDTERLPYGHRGGNHPVRDDSGRTYITGQNHGFTVVAKSVNHAVASVTHIHLNDGTIEGLSYKNWPVTTVQFHPQAGAGPQETSFLFDNFIKKIKALKEAQSCRKELI